MKSGIVRGNAVITIREVAAHAGVGAGTVSRVLNNSDRVSDATRTKVQAAIADLGYRPNPLARGLSRGRCQTIGVIVPDFTTASAIERLKGVVAALDGSRYDLVLFNVESPQHRDEHVASLDRHRADGLVIMSLPLRDDQLDKLNSTGMPLVLIDSPGEDVARVVVDDVTGGRLATDHLVDLGHRRIGFIGDRPDNIFGFTSSNDRELGYRESLATIGVSVDENLIRYGAHDREVAFDLGVELLTGNDPPSAIFCCSDVQALGAIEAARHLRLDIPGDVSVVGFDDIEVARYLGVTTVRQPLFESGQAGTELLLDRLEHPGGPVPVPDVHTVELDLELVVRSTTAAPKEPPRG